MKILKNLLVLSVIYLIINSSYVFSYVSLTSTGINPEANNLKEEGDSYTLIYYIHYPINEWEVKKIVSKAGFKIIYLKPKSESISIKQQKSWIPKFQEDELIITIKHAPPEITSWEIDKVWTLTGKAVLGAFALGGTYLALIYAQAISNYIYETGTPWLNAIRNFRFSQSK